MLVVYISSLLNRFGCRSSMSWVCVLLGAVRFALLASSGLVGFVIDDDSSQVENSFLKGEIGSQTGQ